MTGSRLVSCSESVEYVITPIVFPYYQDTSATTTGTKQPTKLHIKGTIIRHQTETTAVNDTTQHDIKPATAYTHDVRVSKYMRFRFIVLCIVMIICAIAIAHKIGN